MSSDCCASSSNVMILSCSGGSNVGQLANQASVELTQKGYGKMFCLAGIGAHLSGFVQSARDVPTMVVIDGCSIGCAKAVIEQAEIPLRHYLVLTDLGIEKNKNFALDRQLIQRVKDAVKTTCGSAAQKGKTATATSCCG